MSGSQKAARTVPEREAAGHPVGELARRRDWAGLWRLLLDLPLAEAAAAMPALAAAPMSDMTAADMVTTADLLDDPATAPAVRPFLELLRECLACRFRAGERGQGGVIDDEIDIHNGSGGRP
jgi:hypothetical protein